MRKIGELPEKAQALRFCDFLLTENVSAMTESTGVEGSPWAVWVRDEDDLETARDHFNRFTGSPDSSEFQVEKKADEIRRAKGEENKRRLDMQKKASGPAWSSSGRYLTQKPRLTLAIIITCVITYFVTDPQNIRIDATTGVPVARRGGDGVDTGMRIYSALKFVDPGDYYESEGDPLASIRKGELWRAFSPNLLHGSMMHLAFNMMALFFLGGAIERLQSPLAAGLLIALTGITAILMQCLFPHEFGGSVNVVGISGAVYGLFGYLWIRPIMQPSFPNLMPPSTIMIMLAFLMMFILIPSESIGNLHVANVAHVAGLLSGVVCATAAAHFNA